MGFPVLRSALSALAWTLLSISAMAQTQASPGQPCGQPGALALGQQVLVCGAEGVYRWAFREDIPAAPAGGDTTRPEWFPMLSHIFAAERPPACPLTGRITFTSPVIAGEDLSPIIPQGMMTGGHVTPIDHGYLGVRSLTTARTERTEDQFVPVRAPADGEIIEVSELGIPDSIRVVIAHGCDTYSVYMVLNRITGVLATLQDDLRSRHNLAPHIPVLAGEEFGRQRDNPLDFSVHDGATWLPGFLGPFSYTTGEGWKPYTVDPWGYFTPDLAALYTANMQRVAEPRWGRIDLDVAGTASGNWFLDGTMGYGGMPEATLRANPTGPIPGGGQIEGKNTYAWSHLAVAPHWVQPGKWIFSTGWYADERGDPAQFLLEVPAGQPTPAQLTPASGVVLYALRDISFSAPLVNEAPLPVGYDIFGASLRGYVALQVQEGEILHVEVFPGAQSAPAFSGFGAGHRVYRR